MLMTLLIGIGFLILCIYALYVGIFIPHLISRKLPEIEEIGEKTGSNLSNPNRFAI